MMPSISIGKGGLDQQMPAWSQLKIEHSSNKVNCERKAGGKDKEYPGAKTLNSNQGVGVVKKSTTEDDATSRAAQTGGNPLSRVIGGFADDSLWDEFTEEMEQSRREIDRQHGLVEPHAPVLENDTV